jgi:hypothetical protein
MPFTYKIARMLKNFWVIIYTKNKKDNGPKTDPCGTPIDISVSLDKAHLQLTPHLRIER